jgi:murein L,D-transpeptidase YafK
MVSGFEMGQGISISGKMGDDGADRRMISTAVAWTFPLVASALKDSQCEISQLKSSGEVSG